MSNFDPSVDSAETQSFTDSRFHAKVELETIGKAGFATGFILFVILFVFANVTVVVEELKLHKDFNKKISEARVLLKKYEEKEAL